MKNSCHRTRFAARAREAALALGLGSVASVALLFSAIGVSAQVPNPTVEGPVTGGNGPSVISTVFDLAEVGYTQEEYFISGTATAYLSFDISNPDGKWTLIPAATGAYKTRILVYRPARFKGTVVVEWLNVAAGADTAPEWINAHTELIREGAAWVGVSAQRVGVEGGTGCIGLPSVGIKGTDSTRYESLTHPGDRFSYDIFSQAAQAIRSPTGINPLAGLKVKRLIAAGESLSASFLTTYINGVDPLSKVYDGFLVHSRSGSATQLSDNECPPHPSPAKLIRSDVRVPTLVFETETDLTVLGYYFARQADSERLRVWEVAGTSHIDTYGVLPLGVGTVDVGASPAVAEITINTSICNAPINSGPQHFVLNAAFKAMDRWLRRDKPPSSAPPLTVIAGSPPTIMRDGFGNAVGGIRTPQVEIPIAALSGDGQPGPFQSPAQQLFCSLVGTTTLLGPPTLASLYPDHRAYVAAFVKAARPAVRAGFIRGRDASLMKKNAVQSGIGR